MPRVVVQSHWEPLRTAAPAAPVVFAALTAEAFGALPGGQQTTSGVTAVVATPTTDDLGTRGINYRTERFAPRWPATASRRTC